MFDLPNFKNQANQNRKDNHTWNNEEWEVKLLSKNWNRNNEEYTYYYFVENKLTSKKYLGLKINYRSWRTKYHHTSLFFPLDSSEKIDLVFSELQLFKNFFKVGYGSTKSNPVTFNKRVKLYIPNFDLELFKSYISEFILTKYAYVTNPCTESAIENVLYTYPALEKMTWEELISSEIKLKSVKRAFFRQFKYSDLYSFLQSYKKLLGVMCPEDIVKFIDKNPNLFQQMYIDKSLKSLYTKNRKYVMHVLLNSPNKDRTYVHNMQDAFNMLYKLKDKHNYKEWPKFIDATQWHDSIVLKFNKITVPIKYVKNSPFALSLKDKVVADYTIVIPETNHDLLTWGRTMKHCIGSYEPTKDTTLIGLLDSSGKMQYNLELRHSLDTDNKYYANQNKARLRRAPFVNIIQFYGFGNSYPERSLRQRADKELKKLLQDHLTSLGSPAKVLPEKSPKKELTLV